jgi:hypothetical protein
MSKKTQRDTARAEITDTGLASRKQDPHLATYERWCAANNLNPIPEPGGPTPEQQLLVYLQAMSIERTWAYTNMQLAASAAVSYMVKIGCENPRTQRVRQWLKAYRNKHGIVRERPVDAITLEEIRAAAVYQPTALALSRAALLAICDASGDSLPEGQALNPFTFEHRARVAQLTGDAFTATSTSIKVDIGSGETIPISKNRLPAHHRAVAAALEAEGLTPLQERQTFGVRHIQWALNGIVASSRQFTMPITEAAEWWKTTNRDEHLRLLRSLDLDAIKHASDNALRLIALNGLHRTSELRRLNVGDPVLRVDGTGYDYTLTEHKGALVAAAQGGQATPMHVSVDHITSDTDKCPPTCPACALTLHLQHRRDAGAHDSDPLFTTTGKRITKNGVSAAIARAADNTITIEGKPRRISSRTARVTGATELRKAGASIEEVMAAGSWRGPAVMALYLRRHNPAEETELVLELG